MSAEENSMPDERSLSSRGREIAGQAARSFQNVTGALSGANVERQIAEYSELYTQVLLGLHQDLESQSRKFDDHDREIESLKSQVASIPKLKIITGIALSIALVAIVSAGIAVWLAP